MMKQPASFEASVTILKDSGLWERQPWTGSTFQNRFAELSPVDPIAREVFTKMVCALEVITACQLRWSAALAVICFELKRTSARQLKEIADVIAEATGHALTVSWVSRLTGVGALLAEFPMLADIKDVTRLSILRRVPKEKRRDVFASGNLTAEINIRTATRPELAAALKAEAPDKINHHAIVKILRKAVRILAEVTEINSEVETLIELMRAELVRVAAGPKLSGVVLSNEVGLHQ